MFLPIISAFSSLVHASPAALDPSDEPGEQPGSPEFWYKLVISIGLVLAGGVFAGYVLVVCVHFSR